MENIVNGRRIYAGQIYRHFKDKLYQIIAVANHSETGEKLVIYQQLYGKYEVYARPLEMFMSEVDKVKYPLVTQKYRFELVTPEELVIEKQKCGKENDKNEKSNKSETHDEAETIINTTDENVNPYLIKFLDADTYEEKRNILVRIKGEMTDRLIDDIAASMDVAVDKGDIDERYASLLNCVDMRARFEVTRWR